MARLAPAFLAFALLLGLIASPPTLAATPPAAIAGPVFLDAAGQPVFALGANYEGPVDRAWAMWEDGKFDATLIGGDFARARAANLTVLRLFVQQPLAADVAAGRWVKLDRVLDLADQNGLRLVLTFADYGQLNVARLAATASAVAARYRGRATLFAYDLKNEPRFYDLATSIYPAGVSPRLQEGETVAAVGESIPRDQIADYRASDPGRKEVPARLTDDQAWVYANVLAAYRGFLDDAAAWSRERGGTSVGYLQAPEAARWAPLLEAMDGTLAAWLKPQLDAIRLADPGRPITVGQVDPIIASLPVNAWLDYRSLHRYPTASSAGVQAAMRLFDDVRATAPDKPLVLGEFGFSNDVLTEERSAALEVEVVRAVRDRGGAGAFKWMLNDYPSGFNARENNLGMYRGDGQPKTVVASFQALGDLQPVDRSYSQGEAPAPPPVPTPVTSAVPTAAPSPAPTPGPAPAMARDERYSESTGFRIDNDDVWQYFQARGGTRTMGFPVSRPFSLRGCSVQLFQRQAAQLCPGRPGVALLNLLDPETFPYTRVNGSTFPAPDETLKNRTPRVGDPSYGSAILNFVRQNAPDLLGGQEVNFASTFFTTVTPAQAGGDDAGLLGLLALEVWGAPISAPAVEPTNAGFVYQRFQRGVMHYSAGEGTRGILLADYLKAVMLGPRQAALKGASLPSDLQAQAEDQQRQGTMAGAFYQQYCPGLPGWLCRPADLPGSDLTFAFESG